MSNGLRKEDEGVASKIIYPEVYLFSEITANGSGKLLERLGSIIEIEKSLGQEMWKL